MQKECDQILLKKLEKVVAEELAKNKKLAEKDQESFRQILSRVLGYRDMCVPYEKRKIYLSELGKVFGKRGQQIKEWKKEQDEKAKQVFDQIR